MSLIQPRAMPTRQSAPASASTATPGPSAAAIAASAPPLVKIEKQYRSFLANRYIAFAWRTALWTAVVLSTCIVLYTGSFGKIPLALVLSLPVFVSLAILLRTRKSFIIRPSKQLPRTTPLALLISSIWNERSITLLFTYALFSLTASNVWCILVGSDELALFSPTTRHRFAVNERRVVLCASNLALSLFLGVRDILGDQLKPIWPLKKIPFARAVQAALTDDLSFDTSNSVSITFMWSLLVPFAYRILLRSYVWKWVNWRLWSIFLKPFIGSFARTSTRAPSAWSLAPQLLVLDIVTLLILQLPVKAMIPYVIQSLHFDAFYKKSPLSPERYLITALKSQDSYYLQFTLMESLRISNIPARRKTFFNDISKSPSLTTELWQALLLQLGRVNHTLSGPVNPASTSPAPARSSAPDARSIPIRQADIFRPVTKQKSTYGLSSILDGPIRSVPPEPVAKVSQIGAVAVKRAEEVQEQVLVKIEATPLGKSVVTEAKGWKTSIYRWTGQEWARRGLKSGAADWLIAQRIIEVITILSVASIEEDTYGHVQQVLPASLEAIVRVRSSIGFLEGQLSVQTSALGPAQNPAVDEIRRELGAARSACDNAIRKIGEAFGPSLGAFKFPPSIAQALTEICRS